MTGMLCLWTGLMKIAEAGGLTESLARLFAPLLRRLFPKYAQDPPVQEAISMNLAANLLGLGNAATPMGIAAMKEMARLHPGDTPCRGTMLFVVINTASLQLIPTYATAAALIYVGVLMMNCVRDIEWTTPEIAVPAFLTIAMMSFTYSISFGIAFGIISWTIIALFTGKAREIKAATWVIGILFALTFFLTH